MIYTQHQSYTFTLRRQCANHSSPPHSKKIEENESCVSHSMRRALPGTFRNFFVSPHTVDSTTARGFLLLVGVAFQSILVTHSNGIFFEFPVCALLISWMDHQNLAAKGHQIKFEAVKSIGLLHKCADCMDLHHR